jgi:hypothetical protein
LGGVTISVGPETFERVARAIETNSILLDDSTSLLPGVDAGYSGGNFTDSTGHRFSGRFRLRPNTGSRIWDAIFIHEAVHASFDLTGSRLSLADNEAAAYLASAMYGHLTGVPLSRWQTQMGNELLVRTTAFRALRSATVTSASEIRTLREVLILTGNDGTPENPNPMGTRESPRFYSGNR